MTARLLLPPRPTISRACRLRLAGTVQAVSQALTLVENALPDVLLLGLGLSPAAASRWCGALRHVPARPQSLP